MKRCSEAITHEDEQSQKKQKIDTVSYTGFVSSCFPSNDISDNELLERAKEEGRQMRGDIQGYTISFNDLAFVNRTDAAEQVITTLINNSQKTKQQRLWITLSQTYGIGKTIFGQNFIKLVSSEFWRSWEGKHAGLIRKAHIIHIDFSDWTPSIGKKQTIETVVTLTFLDLFAKFVRNNFKHEKLLQHKLLEITETVRNAALVDTTLFVTLLEKDLPDEGFVFLFDEIDQVNSPGMTSTFKYQNPERDDDLVRLYHVWCTLAPFIHAENCFPMSCSKSPAMVNLGRGMMTDKDPSLVAPCAMQHVILPPLSCTHQTKCYLYTRVTLIRTGDTRETSLAAVLAALGVENLNEFTEKVDLYSAGVPRILYLIALELCHKKPDLSSCSKMITFLEEEAFRRQRGFDLIPADARMNVFVPLVTFAAQQIPIKTSATLDGIRVLDAISLCNLHYMSVESDMIQVIVPYYTLLYMELSRSNSTQEFKEDLRLCKYLVSSRHLIHMSTAPMLKRFMQVVVLHRLQSCNLETVPSWSQGVFSKCHFANKPAVLNATSLQYATACCASSEVFDFIVTFQKSKDTEAEVAIEVKSDTTLAEIRNKIHRVGEQITEGILKSKPFVTLIFVCLQIAEQIHGEGLLLDSGLWEWQEAFKWEKVDSTKLGKLKSLKTDDQDLFLHIPENMEVLILSISDMNKFLSKDVMNVLMTAKEKGYRQELAREENFELLLKCFTPVREQRIGVFDARETVDGKKEEQDKIKLLKDELAALLKQLE